MRFCLNFRAVCTVLSVAVAGSVVAAAPATTAAPPGPRIRSVVKADARGRLVRTVVVSAPRNLPKPAELTQVNAADVPQIVEAMAKQYEVDPLLVHSVIETESAYNPYAVSPKGAQGLMQLMPATAKRFGVRNSFDVKENIEGGVRYLKYLGTLFPDDPKLAIAAYNAGEGAVWKAIPSLHIAKPFSMSSASVSGMARRDAWPSRKNRPTLSKSRRQQHPPPPRSATPQSKYSLIQKAGCTCATSTRRVI
jgi:soluble lytic murein transglycosylase-like protein